MAASHVFLKEMRSFQMWVCGGRYEVRITKKYKN